MSLVLRRGQRGSQCGVGKQDMPTESGRRDDGLQETSVLLLEGAGGRTRTRRRRAPSGPPALILFSTYLVHCSRSSSGRQSLRNVIIAPTEDQRRGQQDRLQASERDARSVVELMMGVPVRIQRRSALSAAHASDIFARGFLMTCPSSSTIRRHLTLCSRPSFGFDSLSFFLSGSSSFAPPKLCSAARVWLRG